jgi:hypothetical protein
MTLCLICTAPLEARDRERNGAEQGERSSRGARVAPVADAIVLSGIGRSVRTRDRQLMPAGDRDLRDVESVLPSGSGPTEPRLLRSMPLHDQVNIGVGLFAVTGATHKERELKRTDPMRDVTPRLSRVAGAGLLVAF